jgi:phosphomannomutase
VPPTDTAIAAAIDAVGPAAEVPLDDPDGHPMVDHLDDDVVERYLADLRAARPPGRGARSDDSSTRRFTGWAARWWCVRSPTPVIPTCTWSPRRPSPTATSPRWLPQPRGTGRDGRRRRARGRGRRRPGARQRPDADRLAVGVPGGDGVRMLTGNQIGVLLADHLLRHAEVERPLVLASIVSTPMLRSIAEAYGAHAEYTLTGFKWICAAARVLEERDGYTTVYGFEEALGSMVGTVVRDKDGIGAAVVFADLARALAESGEGIAGRLRALAERHGLWVSHQLSITRPGLEGQVDIARAMDLLRDDRPSVLAGHEVTHTADFRVGVDERPAWLGAHDLVSFDLADGRAMIRPSGTEPKCKIYVDLRGTLGRDDDLDARSAALEAEAAAVAADLAHFVGLD